MAYRYGKKLEVKKPWWDSEIEGTQEELQESAEYQRRYLYKLLNYAETEEDLSKEELDEMRRNYQFARQGPRAWYFRLNKRNKLTSADVIYILTSTKASERLSKEVGIAGGKIRQIRRGEVPCWEWEYDLIRKLKAILKNKIKDEVKDNIYFYILSKMVSPGKYEELYYASSKAKLEKIRKDILYADEYRDLEKKGLLDEVYKIRKERLL